MSMSTEEHHKRLLALKDDEIDYSDIPEPDEGFFKQARLVVPSDEAKAHYHSLEQGGNGLFSQEG